MIQGKIILFIFITITSAVIFSCSNQDTDFSQKMDMIARLIQDKKFEQAINDLDAFIFQEQYPLKGKLDVWAKKSSLSSTPVGSSELRKNFQSLDLIPLSEEEKRALYLLAMLELKHGDSFLGCGSVSLILYYTALEGHALSQFQVARFLDNGICTFKKNYSEAVFWYKKAAENGLKEALVSLGVANLIGRGVPKNVNEGISLIEQATAEGSAMAMYALGAIYNKGVGIKKDKNAAISYYHMAADKGYAPAQIMIGELFWEQANELFRVSHAADQTASKNTTQLYRESQEWFRKAAEQGDANGQYRLGKSYLDFQEHDKALKWFQNSADQGQVDAQFTLGYLAWGKEKYETAVKWFQRAANRGHARSHTYLGYAFQSGFSVPQDDIKAIARFRIAANKGDSRGEEALALAYKNGRGVPQNIRESRKWFKRAASHGSEYSKSKLKGKDFQKLDNQDLGTAIFLGLLALGLATANDPSVIPGESQAPPDYFSNPPVPWSDVFQ